VKVRKLRKNEISLVCKIVRENYPLGGSEKLSEKKYRAEFKAMFAHSVIKPENYVVEKDGEIIGFAGFFQSWMDYNIYEICWVNIKPKYQHKGVGKFLINELIRIIKKKKGARLVLLAAIVVDFYKIFGFKDLKIFDVGGYKLMYLDLKNSIKLK
jgi:ribosomal protein S18 acetylase RimI-like enzyme